MKIKELIFGAPLDPFGKDTKRHIALVAFLAWIGLGADGLSSSCYGPEEAFLALGEHRHLGLYMAAATAATVFIIAVAYNQVIELFPSGGGGYKVATNLIGPYTGLEPISKSLEEDNQARELDEAEEVLRVVFPSDEDPALPLNPCEETFDQPSPCVSPQPTPILRGRLAAIGSVWRDHFDAVAA